MIDNGLVGRGFSPERGKETNLPSWANQFREWKKKYIIERKYSESRDAWKFEGEKQGKEGRERRDQQDELKCQEAELDQELHSLQQHPIHRLIPS